LNLSQNQKMVWVIVYYFVLESMEFMQWIKSQHAQICLMFVLANSTSKFQLVDVIIQCTFKHAFKKQLHMWTSCNIKNQFLNETNLEVVSTYWQLNLNFVSGCFMHGHKCVRGNKWFRKGGKRQVYFITSSHIFKLVGARDLRPLWSPPISLNLVHVLVFFRNF
jgi:hypothetical protein